ncbi:MAG: nickel-dependent lactate racemase [bacterium]|nr:nickel-dependent lactate racemase [bacterium]
MQEIELAYDRTQFTFPIPDSKKVLTLLPKPMRALGNPEQTFLNKLESPLGTPPLSDLVKKNPTRILIIIPDHTRIAGVNRALPWLLDALNRHGIPDEKITALMALGSHSHPDDKTIRNVIGDAYDRIKLELHDPEGPFTDYGTTSWGTPVQINARLAESDLIILYSSCVHHYFAGYGGGRKLIMPGVATLGSTASNHALTFYESEKHGGGRNPDVYSGSLNGNPVHEDMLEAAKMVLKGKAHFAIVTVMNPEKEFGYFLTGGIDESHRLACAVVDEHNMVDLPFGKADLVLASAGGYPKDLTFVQAHKSMDNAARALNPGGTMLLMMACSNGYGNPAVNEFASYDLETIKRKLHEHYVVNGQTVYALKEKTAKFNIIAMTELDGEFLDKVNITQAVDVNHAMELISDSVDKSEVIYHIPHGDTTVPRI